MQGLMMDYQLNVPAILRRGDELYADREIVSRLPDKSWHRYGYGEFASRAKRLAVALRMLGLEDGDRVATFMWNHHEHLETYVGAPADGFVTHTMNLRLHPDDNTYIATHAGDRVLVVDKVLWPLAEQFAGRVGFEHVIAVGAGETPEGALDFEELVASEGSLGTTGQAFFAGTTEVTLGAGATLRVAGLQETPGNVVVMQHRVASIGEDASLQWALAQLGGRLVRTRADNRLEGDRSSVEQVEIVFGSDDQLFDLTSYTTHIGRDTTGDLLSKGALLDRART